MGLIVISLADIIDIQGAVAFQTGMFSLFHLLLRRQKERVIFVKDQ